MRWSLLLGNQFRFRYDPFAGRNALAFMPGGRVRVALLAARVSADLYNYLSSLAAAASGYLYSFAFYIYLSSSKSSKTHMLISLPLPLKVLLPYVYVYLLSVSRSYASKSFNRR